MTFDDALDFVSQERNKSDSYVLIFLGLDDLSIQTIRKQYDLHPILDHECSNSWFNNKDSLLLFDNYFLLTINDADNLGSIERPVSLKMITFKNLMIIFAEDQLYCIEQVFKKDLNFSEFPSRINDHKQEFDTKQNHSKVRIEIGEEYGCTKIESIFHKILEAIFTRLESLIIKRTEEAHKCMTVCSEFGVSDRIEFIITLALSRKNLIYLKEVISPKSNLFRDLLDCPFFSSNIKYYLKSLETRSSVLIEQIQNNKILIKTAEKIFTQSIDNTLAASSGKLNDITKYFSSISTIFLPINLVAGLWGMNIEVPWKYTTGLGPFIGITTISLALFITVTIFFKSRGWM